MVRQLAVARPRVHVSGFNAPMFCLKAGSCYSGLMYQPDNRELELMKENFPNHSAIVEFKDTFHTSQKLHK